MAEGLGVTGCFPLDPETVLIFEGVESVTGQLPVRNVTRGIVLDNEYWIRIKGIV
jgi:hypothetical protein